MSAFALRMRPGDVEKSLRQRRKFRTADDVQGVVRDRDAAYFAQLACEPRKFAKAVEQPAGDMSNAWPIAGLGGVQELIEQDRAGDGEIVE